MVWLAVGVRAGGRQGAAVGRFSGGVIRQRQHGGQPWGCVVWGYLPGRQVSTRNSSVRLVVMRSGNWRQPEAPAVWLAVGFRAGGRQGLPWAGCPAV
ncbi:hypothetical protein ACP86_06030 [Marinobacter sp. CP1]|nr:hypothetical protein ACP86_06030 [Marinobacter sp. CP1]